MLELAGRFTLASFAEHLAGLSLFPEPPQREVSARYRTWAYESAALDLALRQAHTTLHAALGRDPQPVRFVVSLRLGEPPSLDPVRQRLDLYPGLRFKLDPTSSWDEPLIAALKDTRSRRFGRLQGPVCRARSSTSPPTRCCMSAWWRRFPRPGSRTPR